MLFLLLTGCLLQALPAYAGGTDRFAYKFVMTPEEGPIDPMVQGRYTAAFNTCQKRAVSSQDNGACFEYEFIRQDRRLNAVWGTTLKRVSSGQRKHLRAAQREWIVKRDPFCRSEAEKFSTGTIAPIIFADCRVEQTIRRTIWLERLR